MNERVRILLIEDDPDYTFLISRLVDEVCGGTVKFLVESVSSLAEGLARLERDDHDIVLLDLMLPDSRGLETLSRLRAKAPGIPVVVLTNVDDEAIGTDAIARGAQDFLGKQKIDPRRLARAISYALERDRLFRQMESVVDGSPDGTLIVDLGGVVRYVNPAAAEMFGRRREQLLGKPFEFEAVGGSSVQFKLSPASGRELEVEMRVADIRWKGAPARLASLRDVTDIRKVEELRAEVRERLRMDELKDQLLNTVAHELRSPLSVIKAAVATMRDGLAGPLTPEQSKMVAMADRHVDRLTRLLNNFLDLSRLESRNACVTRRPADAVALIREVSQGVGLACRARPLSFDYDLPDAAPPVHIDADMIAQVLGNLLDNAVRYARERILVRATCGLESLEISVIDDGPGIPAEKIHELFNKFVQLDRPRGGSGYKGTGLGLAISREIVTLNGGRIWAENVNGRGACFRFTLPLAAAGRLQEDSHAEPTRPTQDSHRR